eukprot:11046923-Alexandrium_andersonii.AAC.1
MPSNHGQCSDAASHPAGCTWHFGANMRSSSCPLLCQQGTAGTRFMGRAPHTEGFQNYDNIWSPRTCSVGLYRP